MTKTIIGLVVTTILLAHGNLHSHNNSFQKSNSIQITHSPFSIKYPHQVQSKDPTAINTIVSSLQTALQNILQSIPTITLPQKIDVRIMPTLQMFQKHCHQTWYSAGAYLPRSDELCLPPMYLLLRMENLPQTMAHELFHAVSHAPLQHCPFVYHEGLAMIIANQRVQCLQNLPTSKQTYVNQWSNINRELQESSSKDLSQQAYCLAYQFMQNLLKQYTLEMLILNSKTICPTIESQWHVWIKNKN